MSEKINKSFLTEEAKSDINEMLDNNSGGGGSSFTTQIETSEGLTLGKGTENEVSITPTELEAMKEGGSGESYPEIRIYIGTMVSTSISFTGEGKPVTVTIDNESSMFPPERLTGFKPGAFYIVNGTWYAMSQGTLRGFGIIALSSVMANSDGVLNIGDTITLFGVSLTTGSATPYIRLEIAPGGY